MVAVGYMIKNIKSIKVNYMDYGNKLGKTLVLLHGWGQNIEMMMPIGNEFKKDYRIIILDLPGFGHSDVPSNVWDIKDYADCVYELLSELHIAKPILIGHSFGGQVALCYSYSYPTEKLCLLASPFRPHKSKKTFKGFVYKIIKKTPILKNHLEYFKNYFGSTDYKNAKGVMRDILVKKVNLDMSSDLTKVKCPTLIVWGDQDTALPIEDAYFLQDNIKNSKLIVYENATHYAYLEHRNELIKALQIFLER